MTDSAAVRERVLFLAQQEEEWLNAHFPPAGGEIPRPAMAEAVRIGRRWAEEAWNFGEDTETNLYRMGVKGIRWMSQMEECAFAARALYDPQTAQIQVSKSRLEEMEEIQQTLGVALFSPQALYDRLLAHECFHHLEEVRGVCLDEALAEGGALPPSVRDVGAHAFSNFIFCRPFCQTIDLVWLAGRRPEMLAEPG